jgi:hypothetical protein
MNTVKDLGYAEEPRELIQMCFECEKMECTGNGGCAEYRKRKRELMGTEVPEPEPDKNPPTVVREAIEFDLTPKKADPNALQYFNTAIKALRELTKFGMGFMFDVEEMLEQLEAGREYNFRHLIDWDMVALVPLEEDADETA